MPKETISVFYEIIYEKGLLRSLINKRQDNVLTFTEGIINLFNHYIFSHTKVKRKFYSLNKNNQTLTL